MLTVPLTQLPSVAADVLAYAAHIGRSNAQATLLALSGDLGAGKTTFTQALAQALAIDETVQSPTYVLMKTYSITSPDMQLLVPFRHLVHIDAYRLEKPEEFLSLKPDTFLHDPKNLVVIEWPERVTGVLRTPDITVTFSADGASEDERFVQIV